MLESLTDPWVVGGVAIAAVLFQIAWEVKRAIRVFRAARAIRRAQS